MSKVNNSHRFGLCAYEKKNGREQAENYNLCVCLYVWGK